MKALSIQQPWAWAILHAGKDIENRTWSTKVCGRVLIHAGKTMDKDGLDYLALNQHIQIPMGSLLTGGIIGSVEIIDCIEKNSSPWFFGRFGFVLRNPIALPFVAYPGRLGFFDVPESVLYR